MRRIITLISAVALTLGLFTGAAAADVDPELAALQAALDAAQAEVDRLESVVGGLESDLLQADQDLANAEEARDDQLELIETLEQEVADAAAALEVAEDDRDRIQGVIDATANPDGECFGNPASERRIACVAAKADMAAAEAEVERLAGELQAAEIELGDAEEELEILEAAVVTAANEVTRIEGELETAREDLSEAAEIRDDAKAALEAYVPPAEDAHPGCKGVKNAQQQVVKNGNGKGKAAEALATVAAKFDCAA
jgi:chromosome segregation ATPase